MNKYLLRGAIAFDFVFFYFLIVLVVFYFLVGLAPDLWMAGVFASLVLLRFILLQVTRKQRAIARRTAGHVRTSSAILMGFSHVCVILLTIAAGVYLYIRFGWLTALLYGVFALIIAGTFEASYEMFEASEAEVA
jgi:hypothetical protein